LTLSTACLAAVVAISLVSCRGEIANGVSILDVPVGGMRLDEARARIAVRAEEMRGEEITLRFGDTVWTPTLAELGVSYDAERAFGLAARVGRGQDTVVGILRGLHLVDAPIEVDAPVVVDADTLRAYCVARMAELGLAPVDARLSVDGALVSIEPDVSGLVVSVEALEADLVRELAGFTIPSLDLQTMVRPATVRAADLEGQLRSMDTTLAEPLALYHGTDQWLVPPLELASSLEITMAAGSSRLAFDEAGLDALTAQLADEIDRRARGARIDRDGVYDRLVPARLGQTVDRDLLNRRIHDALATGAHEVEIPVTESAGDDSTADLLAELGITDEVASGTSDFSGSDDGRRTNVRIGAELVDGTLLAPGDTFSFNQVVGDIAANDDFVPAGATESGIPGTALGGGICQVSTTLFRATLSAGLPIVEWWPHAYRSVYYEQGGWTPGLDASIQQPDGDPMSGTDFRFVNTTGGYLLIGVDVSAQSTLTVTLSGAEPETTTEILEPVYTDVVSADLPAVEEIDPTLPEGTAREWQPARDGVTMVVTRRVHDAETGELLAEDEFVSTYEPQGPVYRVSPDMAGTVGQEGVA
jgi:vancomycin resistance protein YoaR